MRKWQTSSNGHFTPFDTQAQNKFGADNGRYM